MASSIGGGSIISSWRQHWDAPRSPKIGRYYVWVAVVIQVALSGFMISLGVFTLAYNYVNIGLGIITPVPPQDLMFWFYWLGPLFFMIHGSIGFIFAKVWHNLAGYIIDNALQLIALAFLSMVIGYLLPMFWLWQLFFVWMTDIWLMAQILNNLYSILFVLSFLPSILVIVAGGGVQLYKILRKDLIVDSSVAPRGVRTSHFIVAKVLHREQDRIRDTES